MKPKNSLAERFGNLFLCQRWQAMTAAAALCLLPFFAWLAVVGVSLVTLRRGMKEGSMVMVAVIATAGIVTWSQTTSVIPLAELLLELTLSWLLAGILSRTVSWSCTLICWTGLLAILTTVLSLGAPGYEAAIKQAGLNVLHYWQSKQLLENVSIDVVFEQIESYLLGFHIVLLGLAVLLNLWMARAIQARMFNPGGLQQELLALRLNKYHVLMLLVGLLGSLFWASSLANAVLLVSCLPFVLAGLSILHWYVKQWPYSRSIILFPGYLLVIAFMPLSLVPLIILGGMDVWYDLRNF